MFNFCCFLLWFQQAHQKNQLKDTIGDEEEPEGTDFIFSHVFLVQWSFKILYLVEPDLGEPLTAEEQEEKEQLLEEVSPLGDVHTDNENLSKSCFLYSQGFSTWTRKDFNTFIRACEKYGRNDIKSIASEMEAKTEEEVERYAKVFRQRYKELNGT